MNTNPQTHARFEVYDFPHRGIRNALSLWILETGKTDFKNEEEWNRLKNMSTDIIHLLEIHARDEEAFSLKYLGEIDPSYSEKDLTNHSLLEKEIETIQSRLEQIDRSKPLSKADLKKEFYNTLMRFQTRYLVHMEEEETVTQSHLWKEFSDAELENHRKEIMASLKVEDLKLWIRYVAPTLPSEERFKFESMTEKILSQSSGKN
ncbi:cation-binding protein [Leptospira yasudae]|uniref:cation-binding protein n=1 Tax=Leptospira yasudae TaxID=2202201 RepID=UPI0011C3F3F1|nr:cation-binding protein [Leptospira yasudae]